MLDGTPEPRTRRDAGVVRICVAPRLVGYKPTLVSPGSIIGSELNQDEEKRRHRMADYNGGPEARQGVNGRDRRKR